MSSGGRVVSSSGCVTRPKGQEIGSTGYAGPTQRSLLIGHCVMATAEHREPCDSRGSCTVLGAPRGEIPPGDSTIATGRASCRSSHVRNAPLATVDPKKAGCRDGPQPEITQLFNHEICKLLDMRGHVQAQSLSSPEIYNQFKFCRGLNGEIAWFFTFQNAIGVNCRKSKLITLVSSV